MDDTVTFKVLPFIPEDTLEYHWVLDRRNAGDADSAVIVFNSAGLHQVIAVAWKGEERDRIEWTVKVTDPEGIGDFAIRNSQFALSEPFPNPFNATAAVNYQLSAFSKVNLSLYDIQGRLVGTLVEGWEAAGEHRVVIGGQAGMSILPGGGQARTPAPLVGLPAGVYFLRLQVAPSTGAPPGGGTFSPLIRKAVVVR